MDPGIALACGVPYRLLDDCRRTIGIEIAGRDMQDLLQCFHGVLGVFARCHRMKLPTRDSKLVDRGFVNFIMIDSSALRPNEFETADNGTTTQSL